MDRELLLEIGCEELPASWLPGLTNQLGEVIVTQLKTHRLAPEAPAETYSTPRRLMVRIARLAERQTDFEELVTGPPVSASFTADGHPTPAAAGFAARRATCFAAGLRAAVPFAGALRAAAFFAAFLAGGIGSPRWGDRASGRGTLAVGSPVVPAQRARVSPERSSGTVGYRTAVPFEPLPPFDLVALASEEIAIRAFLDHEIDTYDPYEGEVLVWQR